MLSAKLLSEVSDSGNWSRIVSYLRKSYETVSLMPEPRVALVEQKLKTEKTKNSLSVVPVATSTAEKEGPSISSKSRHTLFSKPAKDSERLAARINDLEQLHNKMSKEANNSIKALLLLDLNKQLKEIDLENEKSLTSTQIQKLSNIEEKVTQQAKTVLQTALLRGEYVLARTMSPFYNLINPDMLSVALMSINTDLLMFLAKDLELPINSYPIVIRGTTYPSTVQYCFSEGSGNNSLLECFSVLIKHGANLMQPVAPDNLPLAHVILSTKPRHPLYAAFEQHKGMTLNNQHFYTHLINSLNSCLRSAHIEESKRQELEHSISHYQQLKVQAENRTLLLCSRNQILDEEITAIARQFISEATWEAIEQDADILRLKNLLAKDVHELRACMKTYQRKTGQPFPYHSIVSQESLDFKKELQKVNLQIELGFSAVKRAVIDHVSNSRLMLSYCMELMDVTTQIHGIAMIAGKKNKRLKELQKRQIELTNHIDELTKTMPLAQMKQYNEQQQTIKQLTNILGELNTLKGSISAFSGLFERLKEDKSGVTTDENLLSSLNQIEEEASSNCLMQ